MTDTYSKTVFLVDDEKAMRRSVEQWLTLSGFTVKAFDNGHTALCELSPGFDGVIVSDVKMPKINGIDLMDAAHKIDPDIPVILITGHGAVEMAVEAMKKSAYDFLEKPFSPEKLLDIVKRAAERRMLVLENRTLRHHLAEASGLARHLIGNSPAIKHLRQDISDLASTNVNVLILGETGTGKEVVAQALHQFGNRASQPFYPVNCGAIPADLFESELFGHEAGAFTSAKSAKQGAFEYATGGTLFLDELTSLPLSMQVKLLRVLEDRSVKRLGSNKQRHVDVRLIAATNDDILKSVDQESFRRDLYYRVNTMELRIPALRERGDDIILLFNHFASLAAKEYERDVPELSTTDIMALRTHSWPGNVRELKNTADRLTLSHHRGNVRVSDFLGKKAVSEKQNPTALSEQVNAFERDVIADALSKANGNINEVMQALDLPRRTLNDKMIKHGLSREKYKNQ